DAALLKDRRVVEADDRHDLAPLLIELLVAGLRAGIWRPVRRIVERRPVDREILAHPEEVTNTRHAGGPERRRAAEIVEGHNRLDGHVEDLWGNIARDRDHVVAELCELPRLASADRITAGDRAIRRNATFQMVELRCVTKEDMRHRGAVVEDGGALYDRLGLSLSAIVLQRRKWPILSGNGHHPARLGARVRPAREIRPPFIEGNRIRHQLSSIFLRLPPCVGSFVTVSVDLSRRVRDPDTPVSLVIVLIAPAIFWRAPPTIGSSMSALMNLSTTTEAPTTAVIRMTKPRPILTNEDTTGLMTFPV